MSRIAFTGNALGTGTVTITSPNTNTDQTVTLPDQTGTLYISGGNIGTPSGGNGSNLTNLNASNLSSGTVPDARFPATLPAASGVNLTALNASNLGSGTVPTARLASGTADSTTYLRGDQTWATVSGGVTSLNGQSGAITNTSLYAIGSYVIGRPQNTTTYSPNSTIAGSSLYSCSTNAAYSPCGWSNNNGPVFINTGTWRCMSTAPGQTNTVGYPGLWVRIS